MVFIRLFTKTQNIMIFNNDEMIFYKDINDSNKILKYSKNDKIGVKLQKGHKSITSILIHL